MATADHPVHPGLFIKAIITEQLRLSVTDAAIALRVTRPALSALVNARASVSPEMALRLEKAFGMSMNALLAMQTKFDIAKARSKESEIQIERYVPGAFKSTALRGGL